MTDIELRDDVARELFIEAIKQNRNTVPLSEISENCFNCANAFMEARALHTKKMLDEMSTKRSYIGGSNE